MSGRMNLSPGGLVRDMLSPNEDDTFADLVVTGRQLTSSPHPGLVSATETPRLGRLSDLATLFTPRPEDQE